MAVLAQEIADRYAVYNGDCIEVMATLPDKCIHLSVYSPPFGGLYHYSSSERDLSNCKDYTQFFEHYTFVVRELARVTHPGRMTAVHCMDVPSGNSGTDYLIDFPGDIIRLHERLGAIEKWIEKVCEEFDEHIGDQPVAPVAPRIAVRAAEYDLPAGLDYAVYDFAVNSGPSRAVKFLQELLGANIIKDGVMGNIGDIMGAANGWEHE